MKKVLEDGLSPGLCKAGELKGLREGRNHAPGQRTGTGGVLSTFGRERVPTVRIICQGHQQSLRALRRTGAFRCSGGFKAPPNLKPVTATRRTAGRVSGVSGAVGGGLSSPGSFLSPGEKVRLSYSAEVLFLKSLIMCELDEPPLVLVD